MTLIRYIISFGLILLSLMIGTTIQHFLSISIPGSIIGMLLLFSLMASGIIPASWVQPSASLFIRYMIILFVPVSVGLMDHVDLLLNNALPILASTLGGSLIVLIILGIGLDRFLSKTEENREEERL